MYIPPRKTFSPRFGVISVLVFLFMALAWGAASARTLAAPLAPAQPTDVACRPNGGKIDELRVEWTDTNDGDADYNVYRKKVSDGNWGAPWQTVTAPTNGVWRAVDTDADTGLYHYRVTAIENADETTPGADQTCREPLVLDSASNNYRIFYRLQECPDYEGKSACTQDVKVGGKNKHAQQVLDTSEAYSTELIGMGFKDPAIWKGEKPFPLDFFPCNNGCANGDGIQYPPANYLGADYVPATGGGTAYEIFVAGHEIFHKTQGSHGGGGGDPYYKWLIEGQARSTEDKMCIFANQAQCNIWDNQVDQYYEGQVDSYLGKPEQGLLEASYDAALFWTYVVEQFADTNKTEPRYGMDFMLKFWQQNQENVDADPDKKGTDGMTTLNDTLANKTTSSRRFKDIFQDFAVANYAKDLITNPATEELKRYNYIDEENCAGCAYAKVKRTVDQTLLADGSIFGTTAVDNWGARYFEVDLDPSLSVVNIEVDALPGTPHSLYYHVLAIKNGAIAKQWSATGSSYNLSVPNINPVYDTLALIVVGLEHQVNFNYGFNLADGLYILTPNAQFPARAGEAASPNKIILQLQVIGQDQKPVAGIDTDQFTITIGSTVVNPPANPQDNQVVASTYNAGQYWLVVRAPGSPGCTTCDLTVAYGGYSDTEADAVMYGPVPDTDNMIIIDRSGSMLGSKIDAAKNAGRLYVDSYNTGDRLGVVSYNDATKTEFPLTKWTNTSRQQAQTAITNIAVPDGLTANGAALQKGLDLLIAQASPNPAWAMVLLSDGEDTVADTKQHIAEFLKNYKARKDDKDQVPTIHVVAIGDDADGVELQKVTTAANGLFQWLPDTGGLQSASPEEMDAATATIFSLDLAEVYRVFAETVVGEQQIFATQGVISDAKSKVHTFQVDGGAGQLVIAFPFIYTEIGIPINVVVQRPDNSQAGPPTLTDGSHRLWRIPAPMAGQWKVTVSPIIPGRAGEQAVSQSGPAEAQAARTDYLVEASLISDLTMQIFLGVEPEKRLAGTPMPILTLLSDTGPILGATVQATVARTGEVVTLFDDGQHGDGGANDGFYGGLIKNTYQAGGYSVVVDASGTSDLNGAFSRRGRVSFYMAEAPDQDNDKMPDWWEGECMDPTKPDRADDPDQDNLNNAAELANHTDPCDADTDDGGEGDGSEVSRGNDPLLPQDDLGRTPQVKAWPGVGQVKLFLAADSGDGAAPTTLTIYRAESPNGPFGVVNSGLQGREWIDTRVVNGMTYCYRATTVGRSTSVPSAISCATPNTDPHPPHGIVALPAGVTEPVTPTVRLFLDGEDNPTTEENPAHDGALLDDLSTRSGVVEMQISNRSDFSDVRWEPYASSKMWTLQPNGDGQATVFARFKDGAGNVSDTAALTLRVQVDDKPYRLYMPMILR